MKVLAVDDDPICLRLISNLLTKWGYTVETATNGDAAWELLKSGDYQVALLDWMMEGKTGPQICELVRSSPGDSYLYLMVVTSKSGTTDCIEAMNAGADDFITKPVSSNELKAKLQTASRILEMHQRLVGQREELRKQNDQISEMYGEMTCMLAAIPQFLITCKGLDKVTAWNQVACELFSIDTKDALGKSLLRLNLEWDWASLLTTIAEARDTQKVKRLDDFKYHSDIHGDLILDLTVSPLPGFEIEPIARGVLIAGRDVTLQKNMENQLQQNQKLECIGELASGIAHELNTPMQFIGDNVKWTRRVLPELFQLMGISRTELSDSVLQRLDKLTNEIPKALDQTIDGIDRVRQIVSAMKEVSHPDQQDPVQSDLSRIIENALTISRNEWKTVAEIKRDFDPTVGQIYCFPGELVQVFVNLLVNASHAIAARQLAEPDLQGEITVRTLAIDEGRVEIRFEDNGTGIASRHASKVFEPFFTTKEVGRGTGLGLKLVHEIVSNLHRGNVSFDTELNRGTTFIIVLPIKHSLAESTIETIQSH